METETIAWKRKLVFPRLEFKNKEKKLKKGVDKLQQM